MSVPRERLSEFYALLSKFFASDAHHDVAVEVAPGIAGDRAPELEPVTGRYAPLYRHLLSAPGEELVMTFAEIEDVLGGKLPPSARKHRPCWANSQVSLLGRVWLRAGWRVAAIDIPTEEVRFVRRH